MNVITLLFTFDSVDTMLEALDPVGWTGTDEDGGAILSPPKGCASLETKIVTEPAQFDEEGAMISPEVLINDHHWLWLGVPADRMDEQEQLTQLPGFVFSKLIGNNEIIALGERYSLDAVRSWKGAGVWSGTVLDFATIGFPAE